MVQIVVESGGFGLAKLNDGEWILLELQGSFEGKQKAFEEGSAQVLGQIKITRPSSTLRPLVLSGPSGAGKSTLIKRLNAEFPSKFGFSVSHTTRKSRPGEVNGKDYHFIDRDGFLSLASKGKFIEHTEFNGNLYGTSFDAVKNVSDLNKVCILDIEMEGVKSIRKTDLNPWYISVQPPNLKVLEERLRGRGTETEESIKNRLNKASLELEFAAKEKVFNLVLVNDNLDEAFAKLKSFVLEKYGGN